jgi:hypothetical protein
VSKLGRTTVRSAAVGYAGRNPFSKPGCGEAFSGHNIDGSIYHFEPVLFTHGRYPDTYLKPSVCPRYWPNANGQAKAGARTRGYADREGPNRRRLIHWSALMI